MSHTFTVRLATVDDAAIVARHRAEMFIDIGQLTEPLRDELVTRSIEYFRHAIPAGEYIGWLASLESDPRIVVAGAGLQRRRILPRPLTRDGRNRIAHGDEGIVLNVFTERHWRRKGLADLLMAHVLEWARSARLDTLVLHASEQGRPLYERLGFVQTNEMRYAGSLSA